MVRIWRFENHYALLFRHDEDLSFRHSLSCRMAFRIADVWPPDQSHTPLSPLYPLGQTCRHEEQWNKLKMNTRQDDDEH